MQDHRKLLVLNLLAYAAQRNIAVEQLCRLAGVDLHDLTGQPTLNLTTKQLDDLWLNAVHLSQDSLFGLHFGESMQVAALGVVGGLVQHSRTVGEALTQAGAFTRLITDMLDMDVVRAGETFTVRFIPNEIRRRESPLVFLQQMDLFMAFTLHEVDGLVLRRMEPESVTCPLDASRRSELERVLRCRTIRHADDFALEFDTRFWDEPILTANYELQNLLLQQAGRLSDPLSRAKTLSEQVRDHLLTNAYLGIPTLEAMAANLNSSPRSLQRRLQGEGVTYQQLADSVRKSLALNYIQSGKHPVKEISYVLGYNELSAFNRAFKRWTGAAPVQYRKLNQGI